MRSHLLPHLVAPIIVYSTLIVADEHHRRGRPLVPRARHPGADARAGATCSPTGPDYYLTPAVADGLARARDPADDARLQPARRRPAGRVRPAAHDADVSSVPLTNRPSVRPTQHSVRSQYVSRRATGSRINGRSPMHKRLLLALGAHGRSGRACWWRRRSPAPRARQRLEAGRHEGRHAAPQRLDHRLRVPRSRALVRRDRVADALRRQHAAPELPGQAGVRERHRGSSRRRRPASRASRRTARRTRSRSKSGLKFSDGSAVTAAAFKRADRARCRSRSRARRRSRSCTTSSAPTRATRARPAPSRGVTAKGQTLTIRLNAGRTRRSSPSSRCRSSRPSKPNMAIDPQGHQRLSRRPARTRSSAARVGQLARARAEHDLQGHPPGERRTGS